MKTNLDRPSWIKYVPITKVVHQIVAGVQGWIETDISGDIPRAARAIVIQGIPGGAWQTGARAHGETGSPEIGGAMVCHITAQDADGHVELFREPGGNNDYYVMGYFL